MRGADKLLQAVDGIPLLRRSAMTALEVGPVIVSLPPRPHARYSALDGLDVQKVPIADAAEGMNASLRGALAQVDDAAPAVMVLLADLPELTSNDLRAVKNARRANPDNLIWRGATSAGKPGHPVIFDRQLFPELRKLTGDQGAQSVIRAHKHKAYLTRLPGENALLDLDTPEAWADWLRKRGS